MNNFFSKNFLYPSFYATAKKKIYTDQSNLFRSITKILLHTNAFFFSFYIQILSFQFYGNLQIFQRAFKGILFVARLIFLEIDIELFSHLGFFPFQI
jgi:hypothetical protein